MAEIDKTRGSITLPGPEELAQDIELPEEETQKGIGCQISPSEGSQEAEKEGS